MRKLRWALLLLGGLTLVIGWKTVSELQAFPDNLSLAHSKVRKVQILDRNSNPLNITYQNDWNIHDYLALHQIPEVFQKIFILAEDKRFYEHHGFDWRARISAVFQNINSLRAVRGASTITEQSVRMLHPRPRTVWSRWVEGFEAYQLEQKFSKADILEFYLNQIPYANQRRGVVQAARYYFDRDLDTLNLKEMMALAVLVRAPGRFDLKRGTVAIEAPIARLIPRLLEQGVVTAKDVETVRNTTLVLKDSQLSVQATHFVNHIFNSIPAQNLENMPRLHTTLDSNLQQRTQDILDTRLHDLQSKGVNNGAVLVVDHEHHNEILAWVTGGGLSPSVRGSYIDAVTTPRQPGSTLKPFLYALALEKGWTASTLINDAPLSEAVGLGMHSYRNYSRSYYGLLRLRDALGNSLNTPAVRTVQFVGAENLLYRLRDLGMNSLNADVDFYGDGLALGNGGITLFELTQAYSTLARHGQFQPLSSLFQQTPEPSRKIFSPEITSIIADILSDSDARRLEFGRGALLNFPVQTAVKTGTSSDYRDAWAIGFNHRYTVGVWLGNVDQQPMASVSGSTGAALVLRAVFAELNRYENTQALYLSPRLVKREICRHTGQLNQTDCPSRSEWFVTGTEPTSETAPVSIAAYPDTLQLQQPTPDLQLAMDPRIPDELEAFPFILPEQTQAQKVEWLVDGEIVGVTAENIKQYLWKVQRGQHHVQARVWQTGNEEPLETPEVSFQVK
ncbi:MAG: penicillin-binding protein 1C [Thiotrichaceae bacterium]|nr:penicillin-binding protein 1C [Thiotrichaceae bacterium]